MPEDTCKPWHEHSETLYCWHPGITTLQAHNNRYRKAIKQGFCQYEIEAEIAGNARKVVRHLCGKEQSYHCKSIIFSRNRSECNQSEMIFSPRMLYLTSIFSFCFLYSAKGCQSVQPPTCTLPAPSSYNWGFLQHQLRCHLVVHEISCW